MLSYKNNKLQLTNDEKVLERLRNIIEESEVKNGDLVISKYSLTIKSHVMKIKEYGELIMAELIFVMNHESFGESFVESLAGVGKTIEEALNQGIANFINGVFDVIIKSLEEKINEEFETNFFTLRKKWTLTRSSIQYTGKRLDNEDVDFWGLLGEEIKLRLGNKSLYLIKVYASKIKNGEVRCECIINGILNKEITMIIEEYTKKWDVETKFSSIKEFFIIKQSDDTYIKYPYTKEEIMKFTNNAVKIIAECNTQEKYEKLDKDISSFIENIDVVYEVKSFIPEIFCELLFDEVGYLDRIVLVRNNEKNDGYKGQFTSYYWIYEAVINIYKSHRLTEAQLKTIVSLSASYNAISEEIKKGSKISDLNNILVGLCGPEGYLPL